MKLLACCFAVLAVASLGQCQSSSEELVSMKVNMIKNYLRERQAMVVLKQKVEAVCAGYGSQFENSIYKVQNCINDIDENSETMCSAVKNHFERCTKPVIKLFEECLPEKSKDVPSFIVKSLLSTTDHLCKTDGEHIFELSNPCARSHNYRTQRCIYKIESKLQQYNSKMPSKNELCEFLSSFKGCFESHLDLNCGNTKTREAFLNLYNAALSPCEANQSLNEVEVLNRNNWVDEV